MQNVFMEPYLPVPSTPELFHNLQKTLAVNNTPPTIFYVSGSPMQTIDPYRTFLQEYFPPGETILQEFSISFRAIKNFLNYKVYKEVTADEVYYLLFFPPVCQSPPPPPAFNPSILKKLNRYSADSPKRNCTWLETLDNWIPKHLQQRTRNTEEIKWLAFGFSKLLDLTLEPKPWKTMQSGKTFCECYAWVYMYMCVCELVCCEWRPWISGIIL